MSTALSRRKASRWDKQKDSKQRKVNMRKLRKVTK